MTQEPNIKKNEVELNLLIIKQRHSLENLLATLNDSLKNLNSLHIELNNLNPEVKEQLHDSIESKSNIKNISEVASAEEQNKLMQEFVKQLSEKPSNVTINANKKNTAPKKHINSIENNNLTALLNSKIKEIECNINDVNNWLSSSNDLKNGNPTYQQKEDRYNSINGEVAKAEWTSKSNNMPQLIRLWISKLLETIGNKLLEKKPDSQIGIKAINAGKSISSSWASSRIGSTIHHEKTSDLSITKKIKEESAKLRSDAEEIGSSTPKLLSDD